MVKPRNPAELALDLLNRSICSVQVAAVIADNYGIFSWGWNSVGSGYGEHAEAAAIRRAGRKRLKGATLYVAARRKRNGKQLYSMPCADCARLMEKAGIKRFHFSVGDGIWGTDYPRDIR